MKLAYLGLFAFVMRDYGDLPKAPGDKNLQKMPRAKVDRESLQRLASVAYHSGFNSLEIEMLKVDLEPPLIADASGFVSITVTTDPGDNIKRTCGLPRTNTFKGDKEYLYLDNLCWEKDETGEGITSFFVLKFWLSPFLVYGHSQLRAWRVSCSGTPPITCHPKSHISSS